MGKYFVPPEAYLSNLVIIFLCRYNHLHLERELYFY